MIEEMSRLREDVVTANPANPRKKLMKTLIALTLACSLFSTTASAQHNGSQLSDASALVAAGSALVLYGSILSVAAAGEVAVASVEVVGESTILVLKGASEAATCSIKMSGQAARAAAVAVGTPVRVSTAASGHVLIASGQVIAFIPNEAGKALLHHSRVGQ